MVATTRHRVTKSILADKCAGSTRGKTAYFRKIKRPHRPTPVTSKAAVGRSESIAKLVVVVLQLKPDILPLAHRYSVLRVVLILVVVNAGVLRLLAGGP